MPILEIDPSMTLGFICKDRVDFEDFLLRLSLVLLYTSHHHQQQHLTNSLFL